MTDAPGIPIAEVRTAFRNQIDKRSKLLVAVGNDAAGYAGETGYTKILSGYHYAYFLSNDDHVFSCLEIAEIHTFAAVNKQF